MSTPVIARQKTAFTVTDADGDSHADAHGHIYFSKAIARAIARDIEGMWYECSNRTSVKNVVTGYTEA